MLCRMSATPTGPRPSPLPSPPLWRSRDYLLWFTGDTLADFGSSLRAFAMPLIAYAATGSLTTAGLVGTVGAVASTVMTVPGGVVVDRVDRKRLIVLGDLARATIYGSAALAWRLGALTPPVLLVVAAASGACAGVFGLASNAMIKHVVPPDRYPSAQAANQARESALSIASNPAGGALMSVSPAAPFLAEAAGHVLAAVSIWRVRADTRPGAESASPPDPARPGGRGPVAGARRARAEVVEGWRWLAGRPFLLFLSLVFGLLSISGTGSYTAVVLGWSHDGLSAARIGVLTTGSGVAMLVGAAGATRLSRRVRGGVLLLAATAVTVSATAGLALVPSVLGRALLLALLFCAAPIMNAVGGGYVMRLIPTGMFGRVGGALLLINLGPPAAAPWLAGRGLDAVGRSGTLWGFTALGALALGLMLASRRLRALGPASQWEAADEAP